LHQHRRANRDRRDHGGRDGRHHEPAPADRGIARELVDHRFDRWEPRRRVLRETALRDAPQPRRDIDLGWLWQARSEQLAIRLERVRRIRPLAVQARIQRDRELN